MAAPARASVLTRVLARVLVLNLAVACAKLGFGYATGALSIISDGFHSLTDGASNVMGIVAMRAARKPPDEDHPYGHRKYETLAAAGIFVFLLLVVIEVVQTALGRLRGSEPPEVTAASFAVMLVTLAVNLLVVRYESERGRALKSELLLADAAHTRSDVLTSFAVILSLGGVWLGYPMFDAVGGLVVAFFIAHTGLQIGREASGILSDRVVMNEDDIRKVVMAVPEVKAATISARAARRIIRSWIFTSGSQATRALRSAPPLACGQGSADRRLSTHSRRHHPHRTPPVTNAECRMLSAE